jgi:hypothetical protein
LVLALVLVLVLVLHQPQLAANRPSTQHAALSVCYNAAGSFA